MRQLALRYGEQASHGMASCTEPRALLPQGSASHGGQGALLKAARHGPSRPGPRADTVTGADAKQMPKCSEHVWTGQAEALDTAGHGLLVLKRAESSVCKPAV